MIDLRGRVLRLVARAAPPFTTRRLAVNVLLHRESARSRLRPDNLRAWVRYERHDPVLCNVCGHVGRVFYGLPDPEHEAVFRMARRRESLNCRGCGAPMRIRTLAAGLLDVMADRFGVQADTIEQLARAWPAGVRVLDTDVHSLINKRLAGLPGYVQSVYMDDKANGEQVEDGVFNVDLQAVPFPDAEFDLIITSEVMEHVRWPEVAHREIRRCLKPGGTYLFTVPYDDSLERTWVLIDSVTDEPLVLPMQFHGDTIRGEGIKSYRVFGRDLVDDLREVGLDAAFLRVERPDVGVFGGDLFCGRRDEVLDLRTPAAPADAALPTPYPPGPSPREAPDRLSTSAPWPASGSSAR